MTLGRGTQVGAHSGGSLTEFENIVTAMNRCVNQKKKKKEKLFFPFLLRGRKDYFYLVSENVSKFPVEKRTRR